MKNVRISPGKRKIMVTAAIMAVTVILIFAIGMIGSRIVLGKNALLLDAYTKNNFIGMREALLFQSPDIDGRLFIGKETAPLTIIMVLDFDSPAAKSFYDDNADWLKTSFSDTGEARIYHKFILGRDEVDRKEGRYLYALASRCMTAQEGDVISFNKELLAAKNDNLLLKEEGLIALAGKTGADQPAFRQCLEQPSNDAFRELYIDMLESERFKIWSPSITIGVDGGDEETLFGDADKELISQRMRYRQIRVGI